MSTPHFTNAELACKHCGKLPPEESQYQLERLRIAWDRPLFVHSAFRCPIHNQAVSNTGPNGPHTRGAFDLGVPSELIYDFLHVAMALGWRGLGLCYHGSSAGRFIHVDRLPERGSGVIWTYPGANSAARGVVEKLEC